MKNYAAILTIFISALSFGASNAFAAKVCTVNFYRDGYCKCNIDGATKDLRGGFTSKEACSKACDAFCVKPDAKPVTPVPVVGIEL